MYHTQEILNLSNSLEGLGLSAPQDFQINELTTKRARFGDLNIGDLLIFDGKVIKKTGDLTAETNTKTGKQSFIFFKKDLVKSVVDKDQDHAKEAGFYYCPYIPNFPTGFYHGKSDENSLSPIDNQSKNNTKSNGTHKKGGFDMFDMENLPSFVGKEEVSVVMGPESVIKVTFKPTNKHGFVSASATINDKVTTEALVLLGDKGFIVGKIDLGVFIIKEIPTNRNYIEFKDNSCKLYVDGEQMAERQKGVREGDTLTIRFKK